MGNVESSDAGPCDGIHDAHLHDVCMRAMEGGAGGAGGAGDAGGGEEAEARRSDGSAAVRVATGPRADARAAIIPHAGKVHAGQARQAAFDRLPATASHLIYVAAAHRRTPSDGVYELHCGDGFDTDRKSVV